MFNKTILLATALIAASSAPLLAGDLSAQVHGIRTDEGTIRMALFDAAEGFPGDRDPVAAQSVPAREGNVRIVFADLPPGTYAATLFHDENGDGELDTNLVGMPTEGIAFSNDATGSFGPASFEDASFAMGDGDKLITVTITY